MAPEFFGYVDGIDDESSDYTHAVDIWALGCVVYRLWTHTVPFPANPNLRPLQRYCSGRDTFPVEALTSAGCTDVDIASIQALLKPEPFERPSAKAALETQSPVEWPFALAKSSPERLTTPTTIFPQIGSRESFKSERPAWDDSSYTTRRYTGPGFIEDIKTPHSLWIALDDSSNTTRCYTSPGFIKDIKPLRPNNAPFIPPLFIDLYPGYV